MDTRNWPWRKKSSEKILGLNESVESSPAHSTRHVDDQDVPTDHLGLLPEAGTAPWQRSDEKSQQLKERLSVALLDASAKDELIKQHAKVAEEAVSGWEKAEAEAMALKQELESVMQQKLATEDRVSHLDGALKECMRQLRHVREEQEEKIHSATIKASREWERVRAELEEKLLDMEQKYLDRDAENKAISKLLQERAITISEMSEARSRTEADLNVLQIRLESMEKEHSALKLDCSVLKKELEKKTEEKLSSKRFTEAASRQHLEDCKKIAKLEGECQRLRGLVRKKLPGSGAMVPIKVETTESSTDKNDSNRKKIGKSAANSREKREDMVSNKLQEETPSGVGKDVNALLDCLSAMEDETRRLKELLARKDSELQHARLMCARTASKLSSVEEQLENLSHDQGLQKIVGLSALDKHIEAARSLTVSCEPSVASVSEDGNDDCSDAWASALIAELAHFKVEKGTSFQEPRSHMPKLPPDNRMETDPSMLLESDEAAKSLEQKVSCKAAELHAAQQLCDQLSHKLVVAERELATLQAQNAATQSSLQTMQGQFDAILQAQDDGKDVDIVLDQVREAMGIPHHMKKKAEEKAPSGCIAADIKPLGFTPDLTSTVCMLVRIVEDLGFFVPVLPLRKAQQDGKDLSQDELECSPHSLFWQSNDFNAKIKAFSARSNLFLQGGANIVQFLGDLASILGDLVRTRMSKMNIPSCTTIKSSHGDTMSLAMPEAYGPNSVTAKLDVINKDATKLDMIEKAYSPNSFTAKLDVIEKDAIKAAPHDEKSITMVLEMHKLTRMEEELRKVQGEKVALETHMRMEFQRLDSLDNEVVQLRGDKVELEHLVEVVKEELDRLKFKLQRAEQVESNLQEELTSAASSRQLMEEQLLSLHATQAEAESQLKVIEVERNLLQDRIEVLERGCLEKNAEIVGLEVKCQELTEQLSKYVLEPVFVCSKCSSVSNDGEKESKEQEIAAKLAECQQTILLLGKQFNTFTSSKEHFNQSHDHPSRDQFASPENDDSLSSQYVFSHNPSEYEARQTKSFLEVNSGTSVCKKNRMRGNADWEPHRDSNASDTLDSELMSLSKSGRPLLELFGDKTPAHEHYIQAVEQLTSSSDEECVIAPRRVEPVMTVKSIMKPPLHRKKTPRMYTGVDMSKSMDDTSSEKHNKTFSRLFSRVKNS